MSKTGKPGAKRSLFYSGMTNVPSFNPPKGFFTTGGRPRSRLGRRQSSGVNVNTSTFSLQFGVSSSSSKESIPEEPNLKRSGLGRIKKQLQFSSVKSNLENQSLFDYKPNLKNDLITKQCSKETNNANAFKHINEEKENLSTKSDIEFLAIEAALFKNESVSQKPTRTTPTPAFDFPLSKILEDVDMDVPVNHDSKDQKVVNIENNPETDINSLYDLLFKKMNDYNQKMTELSKLWDEIIEVKDKISNIKNTDKPAASLTPAIKKSCMKSSKKLTNETISFNDIVKSYAAPTTPSSIKSKVKCKKSIGYTPRSLKKVLNQQSNELFNS